MGSNEVLSVYLMASVFSLQGEGVANAKVYVDGNLVATTNDAGYYRLLNITANTYKIQVYYYVL